MINGELIKNIFKETLPIKNNEINGYKCPCCDEKFDVEEVRRYTDNGEVPICKDCGAELVPEDGD